MYLFNQVVHFREPHVCENGQQGQYGATDGEIIRCAFCGGLVEVEEDPILTISTLKKEYPCPQNSTRCTPSSPEE